MVKSREAFSIADIVTKNYAWMEPRSTVAERLNFWLCKVVIITSYKVYIHYMKTYRTQAVPTLDAMSKHGVVTAKECT